MNSKKLCLPLNFVDDEYWSLKDSLINSNIQISNKCTNYDSNYLSLCSVSELNLLLKNTPIISNEAVTNKIMNEWEKFGEQYSGSIIDKLIFGKKDHLNFKAVEPNNQLTNSDNLVSSKENYQIRNRIKGFVYLKKLWNSFIECKLNFTTKSKWEGMTTGEVDFIEDIHNLQNYMPKALSSSHSNIAINFRKMTSPEFSKIGIQKPDLTKWKINIINACDEKPNECIISSRKFNVPFDFNKINESNITSKISKVGKSKLKKKKSKINKNILNNSILINSSFNINNDSYNSDANSKIYDQKDNPYGFYSNKTKGDLFERKKNVEKFASKYLDVDESTSYSNNKETNVCNYSESSIKSKSNRKSKKWREKFGFRLKIKSWEHDSSEDEFADLFLNYEESKKNEENYMKSVKRSLSEADQNRNDQWNNESIKLSSNNTVNRVPTVHSNSFVISNKQSISSIKYINSNFGMTREELSSVVNNLADLEKDLDCSNEKFDKLSKRTKKTSKMRKNMLKNWMISSKCG